MEKIGENNSESLKKVKLVAYDPTFDSDYLNKLISKAKRSWRDVDVDEWLNQFRGGYEA